MTIKPPPSIFVTYFYGEQGDVLSEWPQDKLRVLASRQQSTFLITGPLRVKIKSPFIRHFSVFSLSRREFREQVFRLRSTDLFNSKFYALYLLSFTFGALFDFISRRYIKNTSDARWSWALSGIPLSLWLYLRGSRTMFATGGATCAHLLACFFSYLPKTEVFLEFQDPLLGNEMIRSTHNARGILALERFFIRRSKMTVFVTQAAAKEAQERNPDLRYKIRGIYPNSWNFKIKAKTENSLERKSGLDLIHLGTLYGKRNLDNLFSAIDKEAGNFNELNLPLKIINLGEMEKNISHRYSKRVDFCAESSVARASALQRAKNCDLLILVQHTDSRSSHTIPYKTYDYLNLSMPIFGLLNNPELFELLRSSGAYVAWADNVPEIQKSLREIMRDYELGALRSCTSVLHGDIYAQFDLIFNKS